MGCASCGTVTNGKPSGCGSKGGCSTGSCNRMNVYDWFADIPISFNERAFDVVEVSFKNGARKGYFRNNQYLELEKGEMVIVEAAQGYDIGEVSLQGELVKLQMKKKGIKDRSDTVRTLLRKATDKDIETLKQLRATEYEVMIKARVMSRELKLDMKLGDVEMQGDGSKATFFYTADDRVDFRELVRRYAKEFRVKIEMRQIGARQEAGRIGGIGSCGRELCCSTWLSDFKTVNTTAARYQNLSINTDKLSGQCGRLKCCLNYELDTYIDAMNNFPKEINRLETADGMARLIKSEILTRVMWFKYEEGNKVFKLKVEDARDIWKMNKEGKKPESLNDFVKDEPAEEENKYEELVGHVSLSSLESKDKKRRNKGRNQRRQGGGQQQKPQGGNPENKGPQRPPQRPQGGGQGQQKPRQGGQQGGGQGQQRPPQRPQGGQQQGGGEGQGQQKPRQGGQQGGGGNRNRNRGNRQGGGGENKGPEKKD